MSPWARFVVGVDLAILLFLILYWEWRLRPIRMGDRWLQRERERGA